MDQFRYFVRAHFCVQKLSILLLPPPSLSIQITSHIHKKPVASSPPHSTPRSQPASQLTSLPLLPFQNSNSPLRLLPRLLRPNLTSTIPTHNPLISPHSPTSISSPSHSFIHSFIKKKTYHAIVPIPTTPLTTLNTNATIPLHVNPAGSGPGGLLAPSRSNTSSVFPAALPRVGVPCELQAERWEAGMVRLEDWRESGLSMKVATRPEAMCHSMWQWKSQTRE